MHRRGWGWGGGGGGLQERPKPPRRTPKQHTYRSEPSPEPYPEPYPETYPDPQIPSQNRCTEWGGGGGGGLTGAAPDRSTDSELSFEGTSQ